MRALPKLVYTAMTQTYSNGRSRLAYFACESQPPYETWFSYAQPTLGMDGEDPPMTESMRRRANRNRRQQRRT